MKNIYKYLLTLVFALCCAAGASAQMKTSYFMEGSIPRYEMNAALTPMHNYVNMPLLPIGYMGINLNNNFLSVKNFIYPYQGGHVTALHGSVSAKDFLNRIPSTASMGADVVYSLVGFGKYNKKHDYFWSFGLNARVIADTGIPKEVFSILKDLKSGVYDIPDITISTTAYLEFALGFTMPVGWQNLVVGGRLKLLVGLAQAEATLTNLNLTVATDKVRASYGGNMQGNIFGMDYTDLNDEEGKMDFGELTNFSDRFRFGNGFKSFGAAVDIGAEAKFLDNRLKVSLALNDLGFIKWGAGNAFQGSLKDVAYEFAGYNTTTEDWEVTKPEGDAFEARHTGNDGYSKRLATTLNIGAEYNFFDNLLGVGLLSHTKFSNRVTYSELTLVGTVRPSNWFTASISQSMMHNNIGIFGLAVNFHPKGVNFFLGVDYVAAQLAQLDFVSEGFKYPLRAKSMNVYIGLAFTPGGRSKPW